MHDLRGIRLDTQEEQSHFSHEAVRCQSQCCTLYMVTNVGNAV